MKLSENILAVIFIALLVYVGGLLAFFNLQPVGKSTPQKEVASVVSLVEDNTEVLGIQQEAQAAAVSELPASYSITIIPRKQQFNLSCEFAAAAAIVYHYTAEKRFSTTNSENAEKILMSMVPTSQNPNLGIRMGDTASQSAEQLYANLNEKFGGENYYGIHAPPFIDIFANYQLKAKAIHINQNTIADIKKALYNGHLVMAWLKVGYGGKVDASFTYGNVPIIKGEHAVVIHGYDEKGFFVMDPGNGSLKNVEYAKILTAASFFSMPFLEVYQTTDASTTVEEVFDLDKEIGLPRENFSIIVENASKKAGKGNQLAEILKEFGYRVEDIRNAEEVQKGMTVLVMPEYSDYSYLLKKDLTLSGYEILSIDTALSASSSSRAVIRVGD